jgi:hypothetical protein
MRNARKISLIPIVAFCLIASAQLQNYHAGIQFFVISIWLAYLVRFLSFLAENKEGP